MKVVRVSHRVLAHHLVLHGYGEWVPNDPRGSGSEYVRKRELRQLGEIHFGRKNQQPSRAELRAFYREAEKLLAFPVIWFEQDQRKAIANAFQMVAKDRGYTVWACAVCSNHAHLLRRVHRDKGDEMWDQFATAARNSIRAMGDVDAKHPVWSDRPYVVYKTNRAQIEVAVSHIEKNPMKEGLPPQKWEWVQKYDGWIGR